MNSPAYPVTRKIEHVDDYHGVKVSDPYRWLEDETNTERVAWIEAQRSTTEEYLSTIPCRSVIRKRLRQLVDYPRYYDLFRRGPYLLFRKNDGLQDQLPLYVQQGRNGVPDVLVDPIALSDDGSIRVTSAVLSRDAKYLAYSLSCGGGDWEEYFVKDMASRRDLPDRLQWVKCSVIAWRGDGFYYSRYPVPSDPFRVLSAPNEHHQVWYHKVGTPQSSDTLTYEDRRHPLRLHFLATTEDERFAILDIYDGGAGHAGNATWVLDTMSKDQDFTPLVASFDDLFQVVGNEEGKLLVHTNHRAPNWRLVLIDPERPDEDDWTEIIPEKREPLERVVTAGGKLIVTYHQHASNRVYVLDRTGALECEVALPGIGCAIVYPGQLQDTDIFWSFSSFTVPTTIYVYDIATCTSSVFQQPKTRFNPDHYETHQVFCPARDGTRIPMFLVHRKGLILDGQSPAILSGYGGFGVAVGPSFDPFLIALLERGVVYALANLRGGGEYGEAWHHAGWREKKQTVFDDCIAAAEWLQARGYTSKDRCALVGASTGGLMAGAVMTQRPDLFQVVLPGSATLDMLRFQHFTIASHWIAEHGSSDDPAMVPILLAYSPLHGIRQGGHYPATLLTTSEHDDRIVPAHSFKFVATLQELGDGPGPYLIRIDSQSGHGPVSLSKAIDERTDQYAFLLAHLSGADPFASLSKRTGRPPAAIGDFPSQA